MSDTEKANKSDKVKLPNGVTIYKGKRTPFTFDSLNPCSGLPNGSVHCFDGVLMVSEPPSNGTSWAEVYTPGVGWGWYNLDDLINTVEARVKGG